MQQASNVLPFLRKTSYLGPAQVIDSDAESGQVLLRPTELVGAGPCWARVALTTPIALTEGDELLVTGEAPDALYVIGVLAARAQQAPRIELDGGAFASIVGDDDSRRLEVYSRRKELIFDFDPSQEKARITVESGDLEFATRDGNMLFESAGELRLRGQAVDVDSSRFAVSSRLASLHIDETRLTGRKLSGKLEYVQLLAGKVETVARSLVEKIRDTYRSVERLAQLRAGRVRTIVDSTYQLRSRTAMVKAEDDFKVNAEQIHLG